MRNLQRLFAVILLAFFSRQAALYAAPPSDLNLAGGTLSCALTLGKNVATFTIRIPQAGCLSILEKTQGRRETQRLWGPTWISSGAFSISLPAERVASHSGIVEFFSVTLESRQAIGRSGNGEQQFLRPMGLGWDPTRKELYVADTGNDRIVRLAADGRFIAQYGGFGLAMGDSSEEREDSLDAPWDVAAGGFSNFYVADQNNDRVCEFDAYKSFKGKFYPRNGERDAKLSRPRGLTIDSENNLWVVDSRNDRILKLAPNGGKLLEIGGFGSSRWNFRDPTQVAVDQEGRIFACDQGNHRISVFDRLGSFLSEIKDHISSPAGVAVDADGILAVCDDVSNELSLYTPAGVRIFWLNGLSGNDRFRAPADVAVAGKAVYLLDSGNHRIILLERCKKGQECTWQAPQRVLE